MLSPIIDEIAHETEKIKVVKINIDQNRDLALDYDVMSIPTVVSIKNGKEVDRIVGLADKSEILNLIQ